MVLTKLVCNSITNALVGNKRSQLEDNTKVLLVDFQVMIWSYQFFSFVRRRLFSIPQKLSNVIESLPFSQRTSIICGCNEILTARATVSLGESLKPSGSGLVIVSRFLFFRRAERDQTFSLAEAIPEVVAQSQDHFKSS